MIAVVTLVNIWGTRKSSDLQNVTTFIKVGIIVVLGSVLLILGFWHGKHAAEIPAAHGLSAQPVTALLSAFGFAMITVLWAYEGWQFGTYSAGEVENPQKSFPRAFLARLACCLSGLYLFAVVAYLVALGPQAATASNTIAAAAATSVLGPWAGMLVAATILISTFSSTNSVMLTAPRVFFAMANDNLFFKKLAEVHPRFGTPAAAVVVLGVWSCILALAGRIRETGHWRNFHRLDFLWPGRGGDFSHSPANRGKPIPYRVPGYPVTPLFFVLAALAIVGNAIYGAIKDPHEFTYLLVAIALMLLGLPGYFFWTRTTP